MRIAEFYTKGEGEPMTVKVSVVISTFNRANLVTRAIRSAQTQIGWTPEVIVVDDCSIDNTEEVLKSLDGIIYLRQAANGGPGPARDRGIREAAGSFVFILDDDDEMIPNAIEIAINNIYGLTDHAKYPVFQFVRSNGKVNDDLQFRIVRFRNYVSGQIAGDFAPIINKELYSNMNLFYPTNRAGGEHLLWWTIADLHGIPTWSDSIMQLHDDAPTRLISVASQIKNAAEHALLAQQTISQFGDRMKTTSPGMYKSTALGAGIYAVLAGNHQMVSSARQRLKKDGYVKESLAVAVLNVLPLPLTHSLFRFYRRAWNRIK